MPVVQPIALRIEFHYIQYLSTQKFKREVIPNSADRSHNILLLQDAATVFFMRGAGREALEWVTPCRSKAWLTEAVGFVSAQTALLKIYEAGRPRRGRCCAGDHGRSLSCFTLNTQRDLLAGPTGPTEAEAPPGANSNRPMTSECRSNCSGGLEQNVGTRGTTRGFLGDVPSQSHSHCDWYRNGERCSLVADKVVERFDNPVDEGLYRLDPAVLSPLKGYSPVSILANGKPLLVFVHGTFSDTSGTFWQILVATSGAGSVAFDKYRNRGLRSIMTLGVGPIHSALTLARHRRPLQTCIVTHSRGGLVGSVRKGSVPIQMPRSKTSICFRNLITILSDKRLKCAWLQVVKRRICALNELSLLSRLAATPRALAAPDAYLSPELCVGARLAEFLCCPPLSNFD